MITVINQPPKFTPASNPVIFQLSTDNTSIVYFKVQLLDAASGAVINTFDIFPTPAQRLGSHINLSNMLENVVSWEVNVDPYQLVAPLVKTVRGYQLQISEQVLNGSTIVTGTTLNVDTNYIWNAEMDRMFFHSFVQAKYIVSNASVAAFLTTKPRTNKVNQFSNEQLYFLQDGSTTSLIARVRFYDLQGALSNTVMVPVEGVDQNNMFRLNISPRALMNAQSIDFSGVSRYVADVLDSNQQQRTEERTYVYQPAECGYEYVNILFINSLGALDSFQFLSPVETIAYEQFKIKSNIYGLDQDGIYSDVQNGIFNPSDKILKTTATASTRVTTPILTDAQSYFLQELFKSRQAFVEYTDGSLVPILITTNSYQVPRARMQQSGTPNVTQLEFTLADGIIPSNSHAYSNKANSISFINEQMSIIQANVPGYDIGTSFVFQHKEYSDNYSDKFD